MATKQIQRNAYGDLRRAAGEIQIFTEKGWTSYPKAATELIELAKRHGWTIKSPGLPVRTNADGDLIIAVLLWRPAGLRNGGEQSPGFDLRVPWVCQHTVFRLGTIVVKPVRRTWREVPSLTAAQTLIREHSVPLDGDAVPIRL